MRILKYDSNEGINVQATADITFNEHELCVIDNALYELSKTAEYKDKKEFIEIYAVFHLLREFVNHGQINCDEIKFAYDHYDKLGRYECWKRLEEKQKGNV